MIVKKYIWDTGEGYIIPRLAFNTSPIMSEEQFLSLGGSIEEEELPDPPAPAVKYSKYKIYLRLRELGLWDEFYHALEEMGLMMSWMTIVDISSDNPELQAAIPQVMSQFPELDVEQELSKCIAE